ncbi:hypothetical protein B0J13DRAFT_435229 [Dactylonectria estremocensis]|uniref:EH domain-containing protein n=1 Tax=Dactylonectria estremocensis TaxID=1079267 RepID=A0A9P9FBE0_9HYPO|nr:hypothetical protein B0J13DRAFT_435229 [Dactylonectria estremocensis]
MTSDERQLYAQVFQQVDIYNLGVITGEAGVKFFDKTGLKPVTLGQIWAIGDVENRGFLTSDCFMIVLRLIGHAQAGREPTTDLAFQPGPRPRFNDSSSPPLGMLQVHHTSSSIQVPDLSPHRIAQYAGLFERLPLQGGIRLSKSEAQMIFKKSDLSDEILDRVWRLADSEGRTTLSRTEFIIAMHLITSIRAGDIKELPSAIPTKLYETAIQGLPASPQPSIDNGSHDDHLNTRSDPWAITPSERVGYDRAYHSIIEGDGPCVTGEVAANFFRGSGLSVDVLWKIWSLADTENRGELSCDEFAIAMHLAVKLRAGENLLPTALPESLVNTSRRGYT